MKQARSATLIGGCGRAGLPLGIALATEGSRISLYDIDEERVALTNGGVMPFDEHGAAEALKEVVTAGRLHATTDPASVAQSDYIVIILGTPVDDHLNPDLTSIPRALERCSEYLRDGQTIILRSTIYPGVTARMEKLMSNLDLDIHVAFCPERIAEGQALRELREFPQMIGARTDEAKARAEELFSTLTSRLLHMQPEEAELAKLFSNAWRYIKFAVTNQLYMVANDFGLDFERIRRALAFEYPRAADMPAAGFAAGPCLLKDTMQLAAFNNNNFMLGHAAMLINEGLPLYLVSKLEQRFELSDLTVGILGMAYKANCDDPRSSLAYKLKGILRFKGATVLCTDPHVRSDPELIDLEKVLEQADLLIVAAPHREYSEIHPKQEVVDIWNIFERGSRI